MHLQFAYDLLFVHSWLFGLFGNSWAFCNHISKTVFVTVEMTSETSSHNNINSLITAPLTKDTEGLKIILSLLACWQTYFKPKPSSPLSLHPFILEMCVQRGWEPSLWFPQRRRWVRERSADLLVRLVFTHSFMSTSASPAPLSGL